MTCRGPDCSRPVKAHGLCVSHYMQERRGRPLAAIRSDGENTAQVSFRCPTKLKQEASKAANKAGLDDAEWWRAAGDEKLTRRVQ